MKSDEPPPNRGLIFKAHEGQAAFQPPNDPDCPEWKTRPFFDFGDGKGFVRMRVRAQRSSAIRAALTSVCPQNLLEPNGMRFNRAYELIEKRIAIERDWLVRPGMCFACSHRALTPMSPQSGTYMSRALPISVDEKRAHTEPIDLGMRYFRSYNISDLFKQMVRLLVCIQAVQFPDANASLGAAGD